MKRISFILATISLVICWNFSMARLYDGFAKSVKDWGKSKERVWSSRVDGKTCWYRLEKNKLMSSRDGKKWSASHDGTWTDRDGKMLKIRNNKLVWSADVGKTWVEVPDRKWEGPDGEWYRFDKSWNLWVNKL
jgi:hypothetical protein